MQALCEELRYTLARTRICFSPGERGRFAKLDFIGNAARLTKEGMDFPTAWHTAVDGSASLWNRRTGGFLARGELLGASSAEGQLAQLAPVPAPLEEQRQAQEEKPPRGTCSRSLGCWGAGLFIPIFVTIEKPRRLQSGSRRGGQPMDVDLIFKIATIGIIVAVLNPGADPFRPGGTGDDDHPGRADCGLLMVMVQEISNLFPPSKSVFGL